MGLGLVVKFNLIFAVLPFFLWILLFRFHFNRIFFMGLGIIFALLIGLYIDYIFWGSYKNTYYQSPYKKVINLVNNLKIPLIDIHSNVLINHNDSSSLFSIWGREVYPRVGSHDHYSVKGYKLISKEIYKFIKTNK